MSLIVYIFVIVLVYMGKLIFYRMIDKVIEVNKNIVGNKNRMDAM